MSLPPPVDPCLPDPQPPRSGFGGRPRPTVVVVIIVLLFTGLLLWLGQDLQTALIGAGSACLVASEVAYRAFGPAAEVVAALAMVVVMLMFAGLLLRQGYDLKTALVSSAGGGVFASEVARRVLDPGLRWSH